MTAMSLVCVVGRVGTVGAVRPETAEESLGFDEDNDVIATAPGMELKKAGQSGGFFRIC
jgi:hypothetical protein